MMQNALRYKARFASYYLFDNLKQFDVEYES